MCSVVSLSLCLFSASVSALSLSLSLFASHTLIAHARIRAGQSARQPACSRSSSAALHSPACLTVRKRHSRERERERGGRGGETPRLEPHARSALRVHTRSRALMRVCASIAPSSLVRTRLSIYRSRSPFAVERFFLRASPSDPQPSPLSTSRTHSSRSERTTACMLTFIECGSPLARVPDRSQATLERERERERREGRRDTETRAACSLCAACAHSLTRAHACLCFYCSIVARSYSLVDLLMLSAFLLFLLLVSRHLFFPHLLSPCVQHVEAR